jgi:hypothetical protein
VDELITVGDLLMPDGARIVEQRYMLSVMCGRSTYKLTWEEIAQT